LVAKPIVKTLQEHKGLVELANKQNVLVSREGPSAEGGMHFGGGVTPRQVDDAGWHAGKQDVMAGIKGAAPHPSRRQGTWLPRGTVKTGKVLRV
jgi:hypothetical protein